MTPSHQPRIPVATYRLQFNRSFTFADAERLVPYLHALGISDCYASPYFRATPGSPHGYDIVDPTQLNPEIGTEKDYQEFVEVLRAHGMGQILDVVPNHMGIGKVVNSWWLDVLENGHAIPMDAIWAAVLTFFSALAAIAFLMAVVKRTSFLGFVIYRLLLALVLFAMLYEWVPGLPSIAQAG